MRTAGWQVAPSWVALMASALLVGLSGCGETPQSQDEIWLHRFVPETADKYDPQRDRWVPESEADNGREESPGMVVWEVSRFPPGTDPTPEQRLTVDNMVERCFASALRHGWHNFEKGTSDGFRPVDKHHYRNDRFMVDDRIIDPDHPEVLMYYETRQGQQLAGFMFYARNRTDHGPQFGGPLTIWHYHNWHRPQCVVGGISMGWSVDGRCPKGVPSSRSGEMMHVWLFDNPSGRFATPMYLPEAILAPALKERFRKRGF